MRALAGNKLDTIHAAIKQDDLQAFFAARNACGSQCRRRTSNNEELVYASQSKAHHIAAWIVGNGVILDDNASLYRGKTCEGINLPWLNALEMAVANDDQEMLALLLPVADSYARYKALKLSVKLNRLEMLQWLVTQGVPLDSPYPSSPGQGKDLLKAAAEGAAWKTASWLINTQRVPVDYGNTSPGADWLLPSLIEFMIETDSPDAKPFLMLLVEQRVNLDAKDGLGRTPLQRAIWFELPNTARLLLEAGADTRYLQEDEQKTLHTLLNQRKENWRRLQDEDCVRVDRALP